eukprot:NODE_594_length_792_cov_603.924630_g530_i0.p1 GENE.NODE_594_length_792_cov_603.924630_g530_i0~~NODE_594_length_792_cov_603.924630_g530_i0.p1  ORF type:complete len:222 (+),score=60.85 NODE_594_length_792_cov_603.924630_g530_i0:24-668(+)
MGSARRCSGKMGVYTYMQQIWTKKQSDVMRYQLRIRGWTYRHQNRIVKMRRPTRPEKARRLGYKTKPGYAIFRIRIRRGGRKRDVKKGICYGKPKTAGVNHLKNVRNIQNIAEQKLAKRCGAMRCLNSYWVNQDATYRYYEVIMVDPMNKGIRKDPRINWIVNPVHRRREARGLTSAGVKYRGLRHKGHLATKARPSRRAVWKKNNDVNFRRYR